MIETKLDGYRLLARIEKGHVRHFTRGGHDWAARFPVLVDELKALALPGAWLLPRRVEQAPDRTK
ncbi:hypothetical protein [Paraburkholderia bannensis]|uniref:hypothetical protein n=1 Tax=Paraburkholderia bannensis TaxID=765414 RepID=UPI0038CD2997